MKKKYRIRSWIRSN